MTTNLPFLRWLVAHPVLRAGETTTAFLVEHPPLSRAAGDASRRAAWRGGFRLNLPPAARAAARRRRRGARARRRRGVEQSSCRADAGHRDQRARRGRRPVAARQPLVVLEAMKMETPLVAPYAATVGAVHVAEGDRVAGGALLVELVSDT